MHGCLLKAVIYQAHMTPAIIIDFYITDVKPIHLEFLFYVNSHAKSTKFFLLWSDNSPSVLCDDNNQPHLSQFGVHINIMAFLCILTVVMGYGIWAMRAGENSECILFLCAACHLN